MRRLPPGPLATWLRNTPEIEIWPAWLLRARASAQARLLARSVRVLRRKRDGRFLAAVCSGRLVPLVPALEREPGLEAARAALARQAPARGARIGVLPLGRLTQRHATLGLAAEDYQAATGLSPVPEPEWLVLAGRDRWRRPLWLHPHAARAWLRMQAAAAADGIVLQAISGYRSHDYQLGIFARKRARGLDLAAILAVNAAPGFSEHHGGCALDLGTPGDAPAEESFERTAAFAWLCRHAADFGFRMSYPRGNPHGITYEPWHWCWHAPGKGPDR